MRILIIERSSFFGTNLEREAVLAHLLRRHLDQKPLIVLLEFQWCGVSEQLNGVHFPRVRSASRKRLDQRTFPRPLHRERVERVAFRGEAEILRRVSFSGDPAATDDVISL